MVHFKSSYNIPEACTYQYATVDEITKIDCSITPECCYFVIVEDSVQNIRWLFDDLDLSWIR